MKEYKVCNLYVQSDGGLIGDYKFRRAEDYKERIKHLYRPARAIEKSKLIFISKNEKIAEQSDPEEGAVVYEPMIYGSHQVTAVASIDENKEKASVFSQGKTVIYDILILYNFLIGQNACLETDIESFSHLSKIGISLGKECEFTAVCIIGTILKELNKSEWSNGKKDKEILSFLFSLNAKDHKPFQINFLESFTALEILESDTQFNGKIFDTYGISGYIAKFRKGDFKETVSVMRNKYIHEGKSSLDNFKAEILRRGVTKKLKDFVKSMNETDFNKFKFNTWSVMDYFLCLIFGQIFGIMDKVGNFNNFYYKETLKYFSKIYP